MNSPNYGFGFFILNFAGERIVGHPGGFPGISSNLEIFLDSGYTAVVLSNYDDSAGYLAATIKDLVTARK